MLPGVNWRGGEGGGDGRGRGGGEGGGDEGGGRGGGDREGGKGGECGEGGGGGGWGELRVEGVEGVKRVEGQRGCKWWRVEGVERVGVERVEGGGGGRVEAVEWVEGGGWSIPLSNGLNLCLSKGSQFGVIACTVHAVHINFTKLFSHFVVNTYKCLMKHIVQISLGTRLPTQRGIYGSLVPRLCPDVTTRITVRAQHTPSIHKVHVLGLDGSRSGSASQMQ